MDHILSSLENGLYISVSGLLPYIILAVFMQMISKSLRTLFGDGVMGKIFVCLTAPGIIIHELGHVVFCLIFGHKILHVKWFSPDNEGRLGYVDHSYNPKNYYHRTGNFFIGTGPVWFGVLVIFLLSWILLPSGMIGGSSELKMMLINFFGGLFHKNFWCSWKTLLWFYFCFSIMSHITLSKADLEGAKDGVLLFLVANFLISFIIGLSGHWTEWILKIEIGILLTLLMMMSVIVVFVAVPLFLFCAIRKKMTKPAPPAEKKV